MKIKDIVNRRIAVHCNTKEKAEKFLRFCQVYDGKSLCWDGCDTCYVLNSKKGSYSLSYWDIEGYRQEGLTIIEFEEFFIEDTIISEIHKHNCEIKILAYLQKWFIEQNTD